MDDVLLFLRAMVREDDDATARYKARVDTKPWAESSDVLGAAFYVAAQRRFRTGEVPEIVRWVAEVRAQLSDDNVDEIDPKAAEWLLRSVVRNELVLMKRLDAETTAALEMMLTVKLLGDERLSDEQLDRVLTEAEAVAASWRAESGQPSAPTGG
jgi:hypothetical protein